MQPGLIIIFSIKQVADSPFINMFITSCPRKECKGGSISADCLIILYEVSSSNTRNSENRGQFRTKSSVLTSYEVPLRIQISKPVI
jgi:hypothetical protein